MKRLLMFLAILICISGITMWAQTPKYENKRYKVELSLTDWSTRVNWLEYVKQQLRQSDLPSKQVALITDSILNVMQTEISAQVQQQLAAEKKIDSTKPKKN